MPSIPYVGIPLFRKYNPSVAPVPIVGTTTAPGNIALVIDSSGCMICGWSDEGGLGFAGSTYVKVTFGSAITSVSVRLITAGSSPGRMRQLTLAVASWGRAF